MFLLLLIFVFVIFFLFDRDVLTCSRSVSSASEAAKAGIPLDHYADSSQVCTDSYCPIFSFHLYWGSWVLHALDAPLRIILTLTLCDFGHAKSKPFWHNFFADWFFVWWCWYHWGRDIECCHWSSDIAGWRVHTSRKGEVYILLAFEVTRPIFGLRNSCNVYQKVKNKCQYNLQKNWKWAWICRTLFECS